MTIRRRSVEKERATARLIRDMLITAMGRKCAWCGTTHGPWHLDHPYGRNWSCRSLSRLTRAKRYLADYLDHNLRLLCDKCNSTDGAHRRWHVTAPEDGIPFTLIERRRIFDVWRAGKNGLRIPEIAHTAQLPVRFVRSYIRKNKRMWIANLPQQRAWAVRRRNAGGKVYGLGDYFDRNLRTDGGSDRAESERGSQTFHEKRGTHGTRRRGRNRNLRRNGRPRDERRQARRLRARRGSDLHPEESDQG